LSIRADGYEELRQAIVSGELLPGERLLEEEVSGRLGLGRAAVRMALVRLEHDGLVERERGDLLAVSDANARLHGRILEISGHETAEGLSRTLSSQLVRFQYPTVLLPGRPERFYAEHSEVVEAIAARAPDAAELAMRSHLSHFAEALRSHHDIAKAAGATEPRPGI
jgi:DNA-binding GntR family transcriptional regulator